MLTVRARRRADPQTAGSCPPDRRGRQLCGKVRVDAPPQRGPRGGVLLGLDLAVQVDAVDEIAAVVGDDDIDADAGSRQLVGDERLELVDALTRPVSYTHLRAHETKANLVCR